MKLELNKRAKPKDSPEPSPVEKKDFSIGKLDEPVPVQKTPEGHIIQTVPKETVLQFVRLPLDERLVFYTASDKGEDYVQAMRMCVSRVRAYYRKRGKTVKPFKMNKISIQVLPTHDVVILAKTQSEQQKVSLEFEKAFDNAMKGLE